MTDVTPINRYSTDAVTREALSWIVRLTSGSATTADAEALARWRAENPAHESAFLDAARLWRALGVAATESLQTSSAANSHRRISRRALIGGALAASIAGALVVRPPYRLWPSLGESIANLDADYRTTPGKQQQIDLGEGVSVRLNTRSSVAVNTDPSQQGIKLIAGEAFVDTAASARRQIVVEAGEGSVVCSAAQANIRRDRDLVTVTCLNGELTVRMGTSSVSVPAQQQLSYADKEIGAVRPADTEAVGAWRVGLIVFRDQPLSEVIEEVNRYRESRIIVTNSTLAAHRVSGTFHLNRLEDVLQQVRQVYGARTRELPGGIVLLS